MADGLAANYTAYTGHHGTQLWAKKTRDWSSARQRACGRHPSRSKCPWLVAMAAIGWFLDLLLPRRWLSVAGLRLQDGWRQLGHMPVRAMAAVLRSALSMADTF